MEKDFNKVVESSVSIYDVVNLYGIELKKPDTISCPFHSEKTASLKIYGNNFYCYGCGASGNAISFVMKMEGLNFTDACKKLDYEFNLGLFSKGYKDKEQQEKVTKRDFIVNQYELKKETLNVARDIALNNFVACDKYIETHRPKVFSETINPVFAKALKYKDYWWDIVTDYDIKIYNLKNERRKTNET